MRQRELSVGVRKRAEQKQIHSRAIIPKYFSRFYPVRRLQRFKGQFLLMNQRWYRANSPSVGFYRRRVFILQKMIHINGGKENDYL